MNTANYLLLALVVLGAVALVLRHRGREKEARLMREGLTAEGTVTRVTHMAMRTGGSWVVDARFDYRGRTYRAMSGLMHYRPLCEPGQTVRVHFLPENPKYSRILEGDVLPRQKLF